MSETFLVLNSMTLAGKAKAFLAKSHISARVDKLNIKSGCGYGVWVRGNPDKICKMLSGINIKCVETIERGG